MSPNFSIDHLDPTQPDPGIFLNCMTRPDPTRGSGQESCNYGLLQSFFVWKLA